MAVFTKKGKKYNTTGKLLYGAVPNNTVFAGFGVRCPVSNNSDAVVRYDQLADRWLIVVPVFTRPPDNPQGPYAMCYAVSTTPDPLGTYYRYEFQRPLFPDYPRPAIWPDGYYNPTSTSDDPLPNIVTQKHECIAERDKMLRGFPAAEQCVVIDGAVFMLNADIDGKRPPPAGAPNIMMSTGGTRLLKRLILHGREVMAEPLTKRRELIEKHVLPTLADPIRYSPILEANLPDLIRSVKTQGLEGLVAKRRDSRYEPGLRSGAWQKMRVNRGQEFVIAGYTPSLKNFDALIIGYYDGDKLLYAARTRSGFTPASRVELFKKVKPLEIKECPFANLPEKKAGRWGAGLTAAKMVEVLSNSCPELPAG